MTAQAAKSTSHRKTPPGPAGSLLTANWSAFQSAPLDLYLRAWREYGDVVRIRILPGVHAYLVAHPEGVEYVLHKNLKNYRKPDFFNGPVSMLAGDGILTSEGDKWLQRRRLVQPAFHRQQMGQLAERMVAATESRLAIWQTTEEDRVVDVSSEMMQLTLRIAGLTLFSTDFTQQSKQLGQVYARAFDYVSYRMMSPFRPPTWFPTARNRQFADDKHLLDDMVLKMIRERREDSSGSQDLLSRLLAVRDEETGTGLTDDEVKNEAITLLTAGHDTVGAALSWAWQLLAENPATQFSLHDEIAGRLKGRSPTLDDLPLLRAVFNETLRLYPPAWGISRQPLADDDVQGFRIPRKAPILLCQYITHRHPEFWEAPEQFQPERFLSAAAQERPKFAYFPFGGGPRVCIGNTFALAEGPLVLATLLQHFRAEPIPDQEVALDTTFTLKPKPGIRLRLIRR